MLLRCRATVFSLMLSASAMALLVRPLATSRNTFRLLRGATGFQLLGATSIFVHADRQVAKDAIVDTHASFKFRDFLPRTFDLHQHESSFFLVKDFVGEFMLTHGLGFGDRTTLVNHYLFEAVS